MRTPHNNLAVRFFAALSTSLSSNALEAMQRAQVIEYETFAPGGRYGSALVFVPWDVSDTFPVKGGDRVAIYNGLKIVYEGEVAAPSYELSTGAEQGIMLLCSGYWGARLRKRSWNKRWADRRLTDDVWVIDTTADGAEKATLDRENRLRITPKREPWKNGELYSVVYTMPTGETIKRVTLSYDFVESPESTPEQVNHYTGGAPVDKANTYDDNPATSNTVTLLTSTEYLYALLRHEWATGVRFDFGATVNGNAATMTVQYYDEDAGWKALSISDGTASGGATWAQDGAMTWAGIKLGSVTHNGKRGPWVRLQPSANLTANVVINEVYGQHAQQWELRLRDTVGAANIWSLTANGSSTRDDTLGTPRQSLALQLVAGGDYEGLPDGSIYGQISNVVVYSETGSINLTEIAKDVRAEDTDLSSDVYDIGSNTFSLVPFLTDGNESLTSILERAASFGDASFNSWDVYLDNSERAGTPNGKPVVVVEQYGSLTGYDYAISLTDSNLEAPISLVGPDTAGIVNWVSVEYIDDNGKAQVITPDDDANLKDATSITKYGQRDIAQPLSAGHTTATIAKNLARRYLAAYKDPRYYVNGPIRAKGFIRGANGNSLPAADVRAGKRLRIENFLDDLSGTGLTFIVSHTRFSADGEVVEMSTGVLDDMAIFMAQMAQVSVAAKRGSIAPQVDPGQLFG